MYEVGLTDMDFGGFCKDIAFEEIVEIDSETGEEKTIKREKIDEEGNLIYNYSLRYGEFVALNTKMIQLNQQRIETLEEEIKQLKLQLSKFENSSNL
jgi:tRNA U34 5-methylaminomethyl-2-thiouridine-forming methyltransferase MnmC